MSAQRYTPKNKIRIVTAASLFDGHDAAINLMRRILQSSGAEIIHLGHDRSVQEIVECAIQEDVQAIAMTSYQGGHMEYFKYMFDLLQEKSAAQIKIFGGGGGVILPEEITELEEYGIAKIYSPDDGRALGLQGMINHLLAECDFETDQKVDLDRIKIKEKGAIASAISAAENKNPEFIKQFDSVGAEMEMNKVPVLGITGTGGAGKSSLVDELVRRFLHSNSKIEIAIVSVDPSKRKSGGALLGDRIRMNSINDGRVYMRSLATRQANLALSSSVEDVLKVLKLAGFDLIILETSGIGQSDSEITDVADVSLYVMTPEFGAASQLEKIDMLDFADIVAINKFDKKGALDALRDVKRQFKRNKELFEVNDEELPVVGTVAAKFNDAGMNDLFSIVHSRLKTSFNGFTIENSDLIGGSMDAQIIPSGRVRYLAEIVDEIRNYNKDADLQSQFVNQWQHVSEALKLVNNKSELEEKKRSIESEISASNKKLVQEWESKKSKYLADEFKFEVRGKELSIKTYKESLSGTRIPKVMLPNYSSWGDILRWSLQENVPGEFPFTSGLFPFKREGEDPTRMFAGEGGPERTNKRFHYVSLGSPAKRLSTAFDSVTLYGQDPDERPDIYGKIGNAGVSVCTLDDAKKLYSGFDLSAPNTSVSMTINGPAPIVLAFYLNASIDQACEKYISKNNLWNEIELSEKIKYQGSLPEGNDGLGLRLLGVSGDKVLSKDIYDLLKQQTLQNVRGTVQADILKEDQAQNTCIFSSEFSLKMMGDVQQYFIDHEIKNFYSVSISGYHIAEAGANPITQLAFTLANGFTYVEYYLSRGMSIDEFGPNLSFFFSNGIDIEYSVIGRVARRIWAKAMKLKYKASKRAQLLKYHIQTSGRSLHAQEIDFNDIRTTLQALYAIYDNCNSLHTNAYDEAITTPTEDSVRRAMAIQMIINKELGLAKNENPMQGSFVIEELTDLVEEAVMVEFERINERGGVLGAMETMYQRSKIQEESMQYEHLKHSGELPIIGVNTYKSSKGSPSVIPKEVIRATEEEKQNQIDSMRAFKSLHSDSRDEMIESVKRSAIEGDNIFETLMEAVKYCTLGEITNALFEVGGKYRRNM